MSKPTKSKENVVRIGGANPKTVTGALTRMSAPMHSLREKSRGHLNALLGSFFDQADDALFNMADQATNNHEQNAYFDSMRELRLRRKSTQEAFGRYLDDALVVVLDPSAGQNAQESAHTSDSLSLVGKDELEGLVAGETMVRQANDRFAEKIQHLNLRIDQLVPVKVYTENSPIGPAVICNAFLAAAAQIELDIKTRLVLYKLFERNVMQALGGIYDQLNQMFIDASILPSLSTAAVKKPLAKRASATTTPALESSPTAESDSDDVLACLRALMHGAPQSSGARVSVGEPASGEARTVGATDLLNMLTLAQKQSSVGGGQMSSPAQVTALLSEFIEKGGDEERNIAKVDADVINLVSMMFEFILDDRNLASSMKVLLGKLQIPMIKVAIADKTFFGRGGHPARRLLNEMANAALGWQELDEDKREKDTLYGMVVTTVDRVIAEYEENVSIFDELLLDFRSFQEREKRRAKILEQRTIDAEDGKARSQRARAEVDAALDEVAAGYDIPPAAAELLTSAWANVLFVTCLKEGADSEAFSKQIETARQLIWSVTAQMADGNNRQKLLKLVPVLLAKLRKGLEDIAFNPYQMGQLFKALEQLHLSVLRGKVASEDKQQKPKVEQQSPAASIDDATATSLDHGAGAAVQNAEAPTLTVAERAHRDAAVPGAELDPVSDASASSAQEQSRVQENIDGQTLALVSNLSQGAWFEMSAATGESYRCRLAAIIKPTGKYIFVNRSGMKVAEESKEQLAIALRDGKIRLLDDGMLFDRALESVIGNLRNSRGA